METKTCSITEDEIHELLAYHGRSLGSGLYTDEKVERINYLNRRLKADKKEVKAEGVTTPVTAMSSEEAAKRYGTQAVAQDKGSW